MAFKNAEAFGFTLKLPVGQRIYEIQSPPVEVGYTLINTTVAAGRAKEIVEAIADMAEDDPAREEAQRELAEMMQDLEVPDYMTKDYFRQILGSAYDEMTANREPYELVKLAAATVSVWVINGREAAEDYWNGGGRPRNPRKAPRDRRRKRAKTATSR